MRKKNKIRLNESQLHNIISESVKQVLSELDWKTAVNAARKATGKIPYYAVNHALNDLSNDELDFGYRRFKYFDSPRKYNSKYLPRAAKSTRRFPERDEFVRRLKQADNLNQHAAMAVQNQLGDNVEYYNYNNDRDLKFPVLYYYGYDDSGNLKTSDKPIGGRGSGVCWYHPIKDCFMTLEENPSDSVEE